MASLRRVANRFGDLAAKVAGLGSGVRRLTTEASKVSCLLHATPEQALSTPGVTASGVQDSAPTTIKINMFQAINDALRIALETDDTALLFGEDVAFGGVFRCSVGLAERFGRARVFNTPLSEQGIAGFAIGIAAQGHTAIGEIQFGDYVFPAFDQIVNEAAKMRYRSGGQFDCGRVTLRMPCMAVGHGGLYHSQSPEAYFAHTPGLRVVVPRSPTQAKGLLLAAIRTRDPVLVLEPKALYRAAVEHVPSGDFVLPLGRAEVVRPCAVRARTPRVTAVAWGSQLYALERAVFHVEATLGLPGAVELIDLRSISPWDVETVTHSVAQTGRLVVAHEAPLTGGFAGEIAAAIQQRCFTVLEAPIARVCGWDTPFPLVHEPFYVPGIARCVEALARTLTYR